eukprot:jgi/Undpi1/6226/HiC_scaffold_20.g08710.m1
MTHSSRAQALLLLVSSLVAIWRPVCVVSATATNPVHRGPRFSQVPSAVGRRQAPRTVACLHHQGAALAGPWWPGRGSGHRNQPALRTLLSAAGVVAYTSTRAIVSRVVDGSGQEGDGGGGSGESSTSNKGAEASVKSAMISFIKAYKKELSPLIPPACRFLPTCSVYGVEAIEKFGPTKGAVLTVWRLMRCNPFAGYGVDHPQWPPPGWFAGEKW